MRILPLSAAVASTRKHRLACGKHLAGCLLQAHAVVLDIPAALCAEQAVARVQHEGGVEGKEAARISYSAASRLQKEGPPTKAEGLSSILVRLPPASSVQPPYCFKRQS